MATIKPEKKAQLQAIQAQLLDVYIDEANPENWLTQEKAIEQAAGMPPKEAAALVAGWKGERFWEKKNANQTMTMLIQIDRYLSTDAQPAAEQEAEDDDEKRMAKEMRAFEKEAKKRLARSRPQLVINNK